MSTEADPSPHLMEFPDGSFLDPRCVRGIRPLPEIPPDSLLKSPGHPHRVVVDYVMGEGDHAHVNSIVLYKHKTFDEAKLAAWSLAKRIRVAIEGYDKVYGYDRASKKED